MKKLIMVLVMVLGISSAYAQMESWVSAGYEHGNFTEYSSSNGVRLTSTMTSPGIFLSVYTFSNNSDIGIFVHDSFLFPKSGSLSDGVDTVSVDLSIYDFIIQIGIIIGPGFRYEIDEKLKLYYGIGFSLQQESGWYDNPTAYASILSYNFGLGGNIGLKYDVSDTIFLNVSAVGSYHIKNYTSMSSTYLNVEGWTEKYSMISLRPYIGIGFNMYREKSIFGKPKGVKQTNN